MSKPTVFSLSGDSKNFVFSNLSALKDQLKVIFPLVVLFEFLNAVAKGYDLPVIAYIVFLPSFFVYACFALSWHRTSLTGESQGLDIFNLRREDWGFIGVLFGLTLLMLLAGFATGFATGLAQRLLSHTAVMAIMLIVLPAAIYAFIFLLRVSFIIPARSVGVRLTMAEARRSSKGVLWPVIGSSFIFALLYFIPLIVYSLVLAAFGISFDAQDPTPRQALTQFVVSIPILAASFVLIALNITALSRAYQWGIQNNPINRSA